MRSGEFAQFAQWYPPVDAQHTGTCLHNRRQQVMRRLGVINHRDGAAQAGDDFLNHGKHELGVVVEIKFATPSVKKLHRTDARSDLASKVENRGLRDFME